MTASYEIVHAVKYSGSYGSSGIHGIILLKHLNGNANFQINCFSKNFAVVNMKLRTKSSSGTFLSIEVRMSRIMRIDITK